MEPITGVDLADSLEAVALKHSYASGVTVRHFGVYVCRAKGSMSVSIIAATAALAMPTRARSSETQ
jgi:hypothetical protein